MRRTTLTILLLLLAGTLSAQPTCENLSLAAYDDALDAMNRSSSLGMLLGGTDCQRNPQLCDRIADQLERMTVAVDRLVGAATGDAAASDCLSCDPGQLMALGRELDLGFRVLRERGFQGRLPRYAGLDPLTRRARSCDEPRVADATASIPVGPAVGGRISLQPSRTPRASGLSDADCRELEYRMIEGEVVPPNDCGLISTWPEAGLTGGTTVRTDRGTPTRPAWSNGCVKDNQRNSGGARAVWTQCAMVPCNGTRLVCEDGAGHLWTSLHVNENRSTTDDDKWEYVVRINPGEPRYIGSYAMYPENGTMDTLYRGKPYSYYGRFFAEP